MNNEVLTLLFDGALAVLLVATIRYCAKLSERIRFLQDSRGELAEMIARFDTATGRATASLAELQSVSKKITEGLQLKIDKANFLADDLAFLIEKSSKLAVRLEEARKQARPETPEPAKARPAPDVRAFFEGKGPQLVKSKPESARAYTGAAAQATRSLEAVLERLASGAAAPGSGEYTPQAKVLPGTASAPRTDAERELLEALKSGR